MQVPRSAIGKMGQCPSCGDKIPITRDTTSRTRRASMAKGTPNPNRWGNQKGPSIEAKERFGRAVDLYCAGNYGEALVIFNMLSQEFPDSIEIHKAREQCVEARNRDPLNLPDPASGQVMGDQLDEGILRSMRRIVVEKMLHGSSDTVQLQAAELVARMAGVLDGAPLSEDTTDDRATDTPEDEDASHKGNGHSSTSTYEHAVDVDVNEVSR